MWSMFEDRMKARLRSDVTIRAKVKQIEARVANGSTSPALAAEQVADLLR
jgi:LAO/AO transport system kinase